MTTENVEFDNTFVTVQNQEIDIHYRKKNVRVAIDKVAKIYITKKKSAFRNWLPLRLFINDEYNLCIKTRDGKEICVGVKASEKQSFVNLVSFIRHNKQLPESELSTLNY